MQHAAYMTHDCRRRFCLSYAQHVAMSLQAQPMQVEQGVGPGPAGQAAPALAPASTAESGALPTPSLQVKQEPAAMSQATQQQLQLQQLQQQLMPPPPAVPPGHPQAPRPGA